MGLLSFLELHMLLYHTTRSAHAIMEQGFKDVKWNLDTVYLSNTPLLGDRYGHQVIELDVDIPKEVLVYHFECVSEISPYREFAFLPDVANRFPRKLLADGEGQRIIDAGEFWNWYPRRMPAAIFGLLPRLSLDDFDRFQPGELSRYLIRTGCPCPCGQCPNTKEQQ